MNRRNIIIIISILAFIVIVGGVSYSYFIYNKDVGDINLDTGSISINLSNVSGNQTLTNVIPLSDNEGKTTSDYFDFTVTGTVDTERIYYEVYLLPKENNTIDTSYIKTYLTDQSNNEISQIFLYDDLANSEKEDAKAIYRGVIETNANGTTQNYSKAFRLRIWLDESYEELQSKTFEFDIYLYAKNVPNDFVLVTPTPAPVPTIATCPGCKYAFFSAGNGAMVESCIKIGDSEESIQESPGNVLADDYTSLNKNVFIGYKLESGYVSKIYVCGIKGESPNLGKAFCIENGGSVSILNSNKALLNDSTTGIWQGGCSSTSDSISCNGLVTVYFTIDDGGEMDISDTINRDICSANDNNVYCITN